MGLQFCTNQKISPRRDGIERETGLTVFLKKASAVLSLLLCGSAGEVFADDSPWNGDWHLELAKSSDVAQQGAPEMYRFHATQDGHLVWEIPELGEVVKGRTDGVPMAVHRKEPTPGLTLSVKAVDPREWTYIVRKNGQVTGGGLMMLVDDASAWVDLTWGPSGPGYGYELVYRKANASATVHRQ